jgi:hypothetical protein
MAWTNARYYNWAEQWKSLFDDILPADVQEAAMATCRFTLQAPKSVGRNAKNWGRWIRMRMQTFGRKPQVNTAVQTLGSGWISTDSHEAANAILGCFGVTLDDVYDAYGKPEEGQKVEISLHDAVVMTPAFHELLHQYQESS